VKREFAALCPFEEFCCRKDLVVCWRGVREEPVRFYKDMRHRLLGLPGMCGAHIAAGDCGQDVLL
jgi:hypothetical protein